MGQQRPQRARQRPPRDLDDRRLEHDACGVGFVAAAGGRDLDRVLPLALTGLASLGHRGAFAADGVSSDGAGVALPLERPLRSLLAPGTSRAAVVSLFLPRGRANRVARDLVSASLAAEGLVPLAWRAVPMDVDVLGPWARRDRPDPVHVVVGRDPTAAGRTPGRGRAVRPSAASGRGHPAPAPSERALVVARRRMESEARRSGLYGFSVPSASTRLVVYKALVAGGRLADLYPDLREPLPLSHVVFHQRYATNTTPAWALAQPFRRLAHNGEIDTVRGNREQIRGRIGDPHRGSAARQLLAAGPLLSPDGSDSLSLDETIEILEVTGWDPFVALLTLLPEARALRAEPHLLAEAHARRTASFLAPWDGPAAIVASDGKRVGAVLDRNGLRPMTFAVTHQGIVAAASEAGAVPVEAAETIRRGRLGPGQLLLVDLARRLVLEDAEARTEVLRRGWVPDVPRPRFVDRSIQTAAARRSPPGGPERSGAAPAVVAGGPTPAGLRYLFGLDAERHRLHLRTMVLEGHEPLWSMGDDTPTPGLARIDRPVTDHLRQAFAQVTNPPIDPDRERAVLDLTVTLGPRPPLLAGPPDPRVAPALLLERPFVADLDGLVSILPGGGRILDATWDPASGRGGLRAAVDHLSEVAIEAATAGDQVLVVSDRAATLAGPAIPSVLAVGAIHAALTAAGLRGRVDLVADAGDVLDVHAAAMLLAAGATVIHPRLAIEIAAEVAGGRGAEELDRPAAIDRLLAAFEAGLRKTLARMGISTAASYIGGGLVEVLELAPDVVARCLPAAAAWPGRVGWEDLADRQLRRVARAATIAADLPAHRLPDPGTARFKGEGEHHGYAPIVVGAVQTLAGATHATGADVAAAPTAATPSPAPPSASPTASDPTPDLDAYRRVLDRTPATVRELLRVRPGRRAVALDEVEPASAIVRRFVASAMSVGALSPEAHQAVTIGMQRAGGAANTGEGGEDPTWYSPASDGERRDARIKQVASGRFGVTAEYLARADQLEIKIAQGSKPGEGGQLPGRKATAYIAALRRGQRGRAYISPPPHHDIYSIEDLAQLIADLRAIAPSARIGVKLVATRGIGTIAAGVTKAGADYIHIAGHAGGTGASPLASIKHVGAPWELGLAEVHQVLLRNDLRDRVALRTDGGLRTGRDIVLAALLGAEEYALGTVLLVAMGCDMARQCHLDTCPTGIATQRDDLRAKFTGSPEQVERFVLALAEDTRRELAGLGARSVGEVIGEAGRLLRPVRRSTLELRPALAAARWMAGEARRAEPALAGMSRVGSSASPVEAALLASFSRHENPVDVRTVTTADRAFGAAIAGVVARGGIAVPVDLRVRGAAGQSFGAFLPAGVRIRLDGVANDYVAKGLSGGVVVVAPERDLAAPPDRNAIVGNTCLYGATGGRLHVVGRAGMRFGVRNSGAAAVVEGIGPHGCEYMTGGVVVVLGPVGPNFGAGMTGGRAYLWDPGADPTPRLDAASVVAHRLSDLLGGQGIPGPRVDEEDGQGSLDPAGVLEELRDLVLEQAMAGSALADHLLAMGGPDPSRCWLVVPAAAREPGAPERATASQPDRPRRAADRSNPDAYAAVPVGARQPAGPA